MGSCSTLFYRQSFICSLQNSRGGGGGGGSGGLRICHKVDVERETPAMGEIKALSRAPFSPRVYLRSPQKRVKGQLYISLSN